MFTFPGRFRRRVAVLTALAMVTSVLVVAAPAAAADPKADYTATFDACVGAAAEDAGFTDVPSGHANAGDIDCIAYYGVTKGTSASTYSPLMSVTREQMALFLTRLAGLVGIEVDDDPDDPGFTDTAGLSDESQTAIAQLKDLGITQGTSDTTYSPADNVQRGHMALFIARLMNKMTPLADGALNLSSTTQFGYTPSDVDDNDKDADIGSPFGDLRQVTKDEFDAITNSYELGVASGISATSYAPDQDITRASMAEFMAGVLDHSNARPAGLSIGTSDPVVWGEGSPTLLVSVRDEEFMPVEDQAVDMFSSSAANKGLRKDGTCNFQTDPDDVFGGDFVSGDCVWNDNDEATDVLGNIFVAETVNEGTTRLFYSWRGTEDGDKFDADDVDASDVSTVSVQAKHDQENLDVSSTINLRADDVYDLDADSDGVQSEGKKVDLRVTPTVTFTAQLIDSNQSAVERPGVSIRVEYERGPDGDRSYTNTHEAILVTDDKGQVSYTVTGPSDNTKVNDQTRADDIKFIELDSDGAKVPDHEDDGDVYWVEEDPVLTTDRLSTADYLLQTSSGSVGAFVYLYDQYGNPHRSHSSQQVVITIEDDDATTSTAGSEVRQVISRGYARWTKTKANLVAGTPAGVSYDIRRLARNTNGTPVQTTDRAEFAALSNDTKDALPITYNDGAVIVTDDPDDDSDDDNTDPVHGLTYDHDNDVSTADISGPYPRAVKDRDGDGDNSDDEVRKNIINSSALDLYDPRNSPEQFNVDGTGMVQVVERADSRDTAEYTVYTILADDNEFLADGHLATGEDELTHDGDADLVYSYDDDDIFIDRREAEGIEISLDRFEALLGRDILAGRKTIGTHAEVEVIAYDVDGSSIFRVNTKAESSE